MVINFQLVWPVNTVRTGDLDWIDYTCAIFGLFFIVFQAIADQQQWDFQCKKNIETKHGFIREGLWKYSRHPNYFAELGLWWCVYLMNKEISWSILGVAQMTLLFFRVIKITESASSKKYEDYKQYQGKTSKLIPWFIN